MMEELLLIVIYCVLGTGLMLLGNMVVDWVIPCHFPTEIKKGNVAVGCVTAGISVAIGIIIKAAIMSPQAAAWRKYFRRCGIYGLLLCDWFDFLYYRIFHYPAFKSKIRFE